MWDGPLTAVATHSRTTPSTVFEGWALSPNPSAARANSFHHRANLADRMAVRTTTKHALRRVLVAFLVLLVHLRPEPCSLAWLLEPVADELAVERRGVDAEQLTGALLLPAREVQDLEDVLLLQLLERHVR